MNFTVAVLRVRGVSANYNFKHFFLVTQARDYFPHLDENVNEFTFKKYVNMTVVLTYEILIEFIKFVKKEARVT